MTILSVRACAALARRHAHANPGATCAALVAHVVDIGAERERADGGIRLVVCSALGTLART